MIKMALKGAILKQVGLMPRATEIGVRSGETRQYQGEEFDKGVYFDIHLTMFTFVHRGISAWIMRPLSAWRFTPSC